MNNKNIFKEMINSKRLKISFWEYFSHYFFALFFLFPLLLTLIDFIKYLFDNYNGVRSMDELITSNYPLVIIALIIFGIQYSRLKFSVFETTLSPREVSLICEKIANANNWEINKNTNEIFQASVKNFFPSWMFIGERVTVLSNEKKVYINSICDPSERPNIISFGQNKKHKQILVKNLVGSFHNRS